MNLHADYCTNSLAYLISYSYLYSIFFNSLLTNVLISSFVNVRVDVKSLSFVNLLNWDYETSENFDEASFCQMTELIIDSPLFYIVLFKSEAAILVVPCLSKILKLLSFVATE